MNYKKCAVVLLVLVCILGVVLGKQTIDVQKERRTNGILDLNDAVFYLTTVMPRQETAEDWRAGAVILGQLTQRTQVEDKEDNGKVLELLQKVSNFDPGIQGMDALDELRGCLDTLVISWDTTPGAWYCTVEKGDVARILELCAQ